MNMTFPGVTTGYTTEAVAGKLATYLDILPVRGGKRGSLKWIPHSEDFQHGAGFVVVTMDRDTTGYHITEYPVSVGRGFMLTKVNGNDKKMSGYAVECVRAGDNATGHCECKGWQFAKLCKHFDAIATLLMNEWL